MIELDKDPISANFSAEIRAPETALLLPHRYSPILAGLQFRGRRVDAP